MIFIDHNRPLTSNWGFWALTATPAFIGLFLGAIVWFKLEWSFSSNGYDNFIRVGTLPIALMSLAFPLGGIYGLAHKSKQLSQQILDEKLRRLHEKVLPVIDSIDAVLVHLYRLSNHSYVLNGWILGNKRDATQISAKLKTIIDDWSALYSESRFFPVMARITIHFEEVDAIMCGYERGVTDYVIPGHLEFTESMREECKKQFTELERKVLEYRKTVETQYYEDAEKIAKSFGLSKSKAKRFDKNTDLNTSANM